MSSSPLPSVVPDKHTFRPQYSLSALHSKGTPPWMRMNSDKLRLIAPLDACSCSSIWEIAATHAGGEFHQLPLAGPGGPGVLLTIVYVPAQAGDHARRRDGRDHDQLLKRKCILALARRWELRQSEWCSTHLPSL